MENVLKNLESVLCDSEGRCCISGSEQDRAVVDAALDTIRAARAQEQAEQEPVGAVIGGVFEPWNDDVLSGAWEIYAAPFRTKDLTDDEIMKINVDTAGIVPTCDRQFHFARAVIEKFKEKNK